MASTPAKRTIRLLDHDPDLGASLRPERLDEARRGVLANMVALPRGELDPVLLARTESSPYGMLVLDGLLNRAIQLDDTLAAHLLGRGDLIAPHWDDAHEGLVPVDVRWTVLEPATVALLDARFLLNVRRWPEIVAALFERVATQSARLATRSAIMQLPRVEDRVHAVLWYLAERWGRVGPEGVLVPIRLTHETLGQLIGAKRPTVSIAMRALEESGAVRRRDDGAWVLEHSWTRAGTPVEERPATAAFVGKREPDALS